MRVLWHFTFAFMTWMSTTGQTIASCPQLTLAITLAEQNFAPGQQVQQAGLARMHDTIAGLNNDDMIRLLRASGQAGRFGDLRSFLTQLRFISQTSKRDSFSFTDEMQQDLRLAREVVDNACPLEATENTSAQAYAAGEQPRIVGANSPIEDRIGTGPVKTRILTPQQQAFLEENFNLAQLWQFLVVISVASLFAAIAHYGLLLNRLLRRQRHTCSVPAVLTCMMMDLPGRITILGKLGCTFVLDEGPWKDCGAGIYATLEAAETPLGVKITRNAGDEFGMLFLDPITDDLLHALLDHSETRVGLDLSVLTTSGRDPRGFGGSAMPKT